ncbi:MAG: hypothetical protein ACRELY_19040 [Polyangiaceae bacterium]
MQTLIDPFELHAASFRQIPDEPVSGKHLVSEGVNTRATLMDVDEIAWFADDDWADDEVTQELDLDLEEDLPRRAVVPRGRGARVWTSE